VTDTPRTSLDVVIAAYNGPRDTVFTRSSALFDRAERRLEEHSRPVDPAQLAIRDLKLIHATMARRAELLGLQVADFDTSVVHGVDPAAIRSAGSPAAISPVGISHGRDVPPGAKSPTAEAPEDRRTQPAPA
jgi:hypothetical protein